MKIQFFGAARTVTGSKHLITTDNGTKILLDCGLFQGIHTDDVNQNFGFDPSQIDYVLVSHAHIDHTGLLPRLVRKGFKGDIYATPATRDLCEIMLMDSAFIQQKDLERVNKKRKEKGQADLELLYDANDVAATLKLFKTVNYRQTFYLNQNEIAITFTDTAHLLGSAAINLQIKDGETTKKITFSGDIGRPNDKILRSFDAFPQADYIICESTYGNKLHEPEADMKAHLLKIVRETCVEQKGKVLIPAFAVDRTQEIIFALDQLSSEGLLPVIKVFIDSPLSVKATQVMKKHEECFNPNILEYIERDGDAFAFPNLEYISAVEDSKKINTSNEPCIIISSSGMAEAGRIKHHIFNNIEKENTTILLVGYCSPISLGGALKRGDKVVTIFGQKRTVKARVEVMDSFSAHGDYREMIQFLGCQNSASVKKLFLVHGEYENQLAFKTRLEAVGFENVEIPEMEQVFEL